MIDKDGNRILRTDSTPATEDDLRQLPPSRSRWRVRFSNYFPAEIDSEWPTQAQADARVDELNGDGGGMWEVEEVTS